MMNVSLSLTAFLLLLTTSVHAHGQHRSLLGPLQGRANGNGFNNGTGNGNGSIRGNKNNVKGWKFDFSDVKGGARGYLTRLDESKIQRLRRNSRFEGRLEELASLLDEDQDFGIDTISDALIYVCENIEPPSAEDTLVTAPGEVLELQSGTEDANDPDPPIENVWKLASRPTARKKIWLDFRGGSVNGTAWLSGAKITWPPYDLDGNPNSFSAAEQRAIIAIWRAVSEDFAPFNVDVTTINQIALRRAFSTYMRVAIGGTSSHVMDVQTGGTAFVGVYGDASGLYQPAWVFSANLRGGDPKSVWEAVSHEVGHTMGLNHDGISVSGTVQSYYSGHNGWAPIMGVGYNQAVTQWSKGDYLDATQKQDDLAVIAAKLGYAQSGNGNTAAAATRLVPSPNTDGTVWAAANGIITRTNRADYFTLNASSGSLTVSVSNIPGWVPQAGVSVNRANLNVQVTVLTSSLGRIGAWDDPNGLMAVRAFTLPANGMYYIAVRGVGSGSATALTGYSSYGSLGQFFLNATYRAL